MLALMGDRVILRDFVEDDWVHVHRYASRDDVTRYVVWGPNDEAMTKDFVNNAVAEAAKPLGERAAFELAVVLSDVRTLIGCCSLFVESTVHMKAELGYCFHPDYWGKGYATEAAGLIVDFGFRTLGMHRIFATCDPANVGSRRVLEKAGLGYEGHMRHDLKGRTGWRDSLLLAVLEDDWRAGVVS